MSGPGEAAQPPADPARSGPPLPATGLPPGRLVFGDEGDDDQPALWVSYDPATAAQWATLRAAHPRTGWWPLLLGGLAGDRDRPWDAGELEPAAMSDPARFDAEQLLAGWWGEHTGGGSGDELTEQRRLAVTAPYGRRWPGPAPAAPARDDPGRCADHRAGLLLAERPGLRLGLVATGWSSDAVTVAGWLGAANYTDDTAKLSAVLRSWERRFGIRVIGAGFAELWLSVAAPPRDAGAALRVAAEHFAFCPDNVWQRADPRLTDYAGTLVDAPLWSFWWD